MKAIITPKSPLPVGPYSQAIEVNGFLYVSGQLPLNMQTGIMEENITQATEACINNLQAILEQACSSLNNVVKTTVFLSDMANFAQMNEVYSKYFSEPYPARSCIAVRELPKSVIVEIECIAKLNIL